MNTPDTPEASDYELRHPRYQTLEVSHPNTKLNIRLIEPHTYHAPESLKWLSQPEIGQHMGADFSDVSLATETKRLQDMIDSTDEYNWMIELNENVIGNVCINSIAERTKADNCRSGSMAILIGDRDSWGKQIARYVNRAVLDWAFMNGGFAMLHARIMLENIGSMKSFTALGFEETGTEEEKMDDKMIRWNHYRMTKENFLTIQRSNPLHPNQ